VKVLILGASGMIGSTVFRLLSENKQYETFGTVRDGRVSQYFPASMGKQLIEDIDVENHDSLVRVLEKARPDMVVNCAGLTKHKPGAENPLVSLPINTLMPHRLAELCGLVDTRLIHISTDCVFSGEKGNYVEEDFTDARDLYGQSKAMGEVHYPHAITLRTSTIGPELNTQYGLLEWFFAQETQCSGYTRAIFSGLPTIVFAQIIRDIVIPNNDLSGLYHVAAKPIAKFDLLTILAQVYGKAINIVPDDQFVIDRSLNAMRFKLATGYTAPDWPELIKMMFASHIDLD
jgi:dTDP-4-dehydrorhamnose reductase